MRQAELSTSGVSTTLNFYCFDFEISHAAYNPEIEKSARIEEVLLEFQKRTIIGYLVFLKVMLILSEIRKTYVFSIEGGTVNLYGTTGHLIVSC
jgi:hypothetical protein